MPKPLSTAIAAVILAFAAPALAQVTTPNHQPQPGSPMAQAGKMDAVGFAIQAMAAHQQGVMTGEIASTKSKTKAVKELARMMVGDHTAESNKLMGVLKAANVKPPSSISDPKTVALMAGLQAADDAAFDGLYLQSQAQAHEDAIRLFENYARDGEQADLKAYAAETLPALRQHLELFKAVPKPV